MESEKIERKFEVSGPAHLNLANISGSVDIQAGEDSAILVSAVRGQGGDPERTRIDMDQAADGTVTVKTEYGDSFWNWFGQRPSDVDYTVRVPANTSVHLRCVSSRGSVKGLTGQFDLNCVSGDLMLEDLSGTIKVNMVSGNLSGAGLSGTGNVETISGQVNLRGCSLESLKGSTVSGQVALETQQVTGPYKFHSISGDVRLALPADARCTIECTSMSGRVVANLPVTHSEKRGQRRRLELQGGGPEIHFDSISGNLEVSGSLKANGSLGVQAPVPVATMKDLGFAVDAPAGSGAPQAPVPPAPPPAPPEPSVSEQEVEAEARARQDILDRVARGDLSVDQAINMLRG